MRTASKRAVAVVENQNTASLVKARNIKLEKSARKSMDVPALTVEQLIRRACDHEQLQREMDSNPAPARLYCPGESAAVDAAITVLQLKTNRHTTWWDVVRMFLDQGSVASAKIALPYTAKAGRVKRQEPRKSRWWWLEGFQALVRKTN